MNEAIARRRLWNQLITRSARRSPAEVVAWFGAMQGQEFVPAKWAVGLRMPDGADDQGVQAAFDQGRILRTHVMRPTWHLVTPADIVWLQELTAPRVQRLMATYARELELDAAVLTRVTDVMVRALEGGRHLTRTALGDALERAGLVMRGRRLAHAVIHAELERVVCSGPRVGKQFTYALLAERAPLALRLPREEALARLMSRYLASHGPATVRDFVWWSGLTSADARRALEIVKARGEDADGLTYWSAGPAPRGAAREEVVHLLPIYDEYLIAYRDRLAVPHVAMASGGGETSVTFRHALVISGQVAGTWDMTRGTQGIRIRVTPVRPLRRRERAALDPAAHRFEAFAGSPVTLSVGG